MCPLFLSFLFVLLKPKFSNDKLRELRIEKYQKNMKEIFNILMKKGNPKLAIRYAKRIIVGNRGKTPSEIAPGTKVHELVEELIKYLPENIIRGRNMKNETEKFLIFEYENR